MAVAHEASSAVRLEPAVSETAARLFQEHSGWIYGYCLRLLRSPEEAEDALQATYLNACRGLKDGIRPQVDSAWLLRIAQNVCLTRLRSSGRRARLERVQDVELLEETVAAHAYHGDELIGLTDALASLPEQQRRAILLREWQGLSYAEVAARLELTQSAVETLIFRARRSLAAALENPGKRRRLRLAHALDVAGLLAAFKGFFAGSASAKIAAAVVVAATTATVAATDPAGVWRDRADVPAGPAVAVEQTEATGRPASAPVVPASMQSHSDAAERAFYDTRGGPALDRAKRGGVSGPATAEAAKAKANGKGKALGHAKQ
ncbi:MAG: RNA polymerase sigma factor, partial [Gaiellaceae bacterium]